LPNSKQFYVTFQPTSTGPKSSYILFFHNAPTSPDTVLVSGTGADSAVLHFSGPRWNMVSIAFKVDDPRVFSIFPTAGSKAFLYDPASGYVLKDSMVLGTGYWIKLKDSTTAIEGGSFVGEDTIPVIKGWNLIGSVSGPVPAFTIASIPGGLVTSNFFSYDGNYRTTDTIFPGRGYWVKSAELGQLILSSDTSTRAIPKRSIRIVPISELPPAPPSVESETVADIPKSYLIESAYPNPFNPSTTLRYELPSRSAVRLTIIDLLGTTVTTLVEGVQEAGRYEIVWNAAGNASGVYFYRLEAYDLRSPSTGSLQVGKLLLMK
jgi:hypothetical protein